MTSQNEEAEELMRKIEKEEEQVVIGKTFSCIVEKKVDLTKKKSNFAFSFSACLRGPRQKSVSFMYCQFGNWYPVLRQRKLRIWHFKSHQIFGTVQQKIRHRYLVLCQKMLFVLDRKLGQAYD